MNRKLLILLFITFSFILSAQTSEWEWATQAGGIHEDRGYGIAIDCYGNSYSTGLFKSTADFGSYSLTSSGISDIYVAKMDADGNWIWAVKAGGSGNDGSHAISLDNDGSSYITGHFTSISTFGPYTLTSDSDYDIFVAKTDSLGNWLWAIQASGTNVEHGYEITTDENGNCYLTGYFTGTANFGSYSLTSNGDLDIFVAKVDTNGNWIWAIQAGGSEWDYGYSIEIDENMNSYITGSFQETATFGSMTVTSSGGSDIFVAKVDTNGNWLWVVKAGGEGSDIGFSISVDNSGKSYLTGFFYDDVTFGPYFLINSNSGYSDVFVANIDTDGNWIWVNQAGGNSGDRGYGIALDEYDCSYVTGMFSGTAVFGANTLTCIGESDIFAAKMDPNGNWQWAVQSCGNGNDYGIGITTDDIGNFYLTGVFENTMNLGPYSLTSHGETDIFMAKCDFYFSDFVADNTIGNCPLLVNFTDLSIGVPTSWEWDFDNDGTIDSYEQNPTHIYTEIGFYTVSLTVNDGSNTDTETKVDYITVGDPVIADFVADPLIGLLPLTVNFTDLSTGSTAISWEWDFDNDGTIDSYEQNPTHIYSEEGMFTVSLTASDGSYADTETKVDYITVGEPIIADFEAEPLIGLAPLNVQFTDLSSGGLDIMLNLEKNANINSKTNNKKILSAENSREIVSWEWDFNNDGTIDSNEQNPLHIYNEEGTYTVILTVSDGTFTNSETKVDYITVGEPIIADFEAEPLEGIVPLEVQFTNLSTGGLTDLLRDSANNNNSSVIKKEKSREIVSWEWDFENDGTIDSNEQDPLHTYSVEGTYTVKLIVSDGTFTNSETKVDYIAVGDPIIADFEAEPLEGLQPLEVQFTDLSTGGLPGLLCGPTKKSNLKYVQKENSRDIVSWEWDFNNDGVIDSYNQNPTFTYNQEGVYSVALVVSDGTNEDTEIKVDYITVNPVSGDIGLLPINTQLYSNHPNPFNPLTNVSFDIKENETGTLTLFNTKGQIIESHQFESGKHNYIWDASNQASGIYFYKLQTQTMTETKKMLLLK